MTSEKNIFECKYCHEPFIQEKAYKNHRCKKMIRLEEMQTKVGQAAWRHYQLWFRLKKHKVPEIDTFLDSTFYTQFIKFAKFVQKMNINDIEQYIGFMIYKKYTNPFLWVNNDIFAEYLQFAMTDIEPWNQVDITIKWMDRLCSERDCKISQIIDILEPYEILDLIFQRRFMPWLFLNSVKFNKKFKEFKMGQRKELNKIVNGMYWKRTFEKQPNLVREIRNFAKKLDI